MRRARLVGAVLVLGAAACGLLPSGGLSHGLREVTVAAAVIDAGVDAGFAAWVDDGGCSCATWGQPVNAGPVADPELIELSGLAASRAHPGVLWAHNDSGDSARFFAVSSTGEARGRFALTGAVAQDIEDIALGPCPTGTCIYLGDIGDNLTVRNDYTVYRVAEPQPSPDAGVTAIPVAFEHFDFQYPQGAHFNAETLLVHPTSGDVYVITKHGSGIKSRVYRFPRPLNPTGQVTLELVGELSVPEAGDLPLTAGDISPCGNALLLRTYNRVVELRLPAGAPFETVFGVAPRALPTPAELQGEAITWAPDGLGYFTGTEGASQMLHRVSCP